MLRWLYSLIKSLFSRIFRYLGISPKPKEFTLKVHIKTTTGISFLIELNPKWDIGQIKKIVAPEVDLTEDQISIIFAGKDLADNLLLEECDLGQHSFLHAVKLKVMKKDEGKPIKTEDTNSAFQDKPLCETLLDLQLTKEEKELLRRSIEGCSSPEYQQKKAHFYVFCDNPCGSVENGKLRVRCGSCKTGAFTVDRDPCCWEDVLQPDQVSGTCQNEICCNAWAEFYFKCARHPSKGEGDSALPLNLIKSNFKQIQCLACLDICDPVIVFPCTSAHVICIECFEQYCLSRLNERQFVFDSHIGYSLGCPAGCEKSLIEETHHFQILGRDQYLRLLHFGAEEYTMSTGGILCPQPGCGNGLIPDPSCRRVQCTSGCEFVFCRDCRQGYHIDECLTTDDNTYNSMLSSTNYVVDPERASQARWEADSHATIRITSKPCPKCRTPTERSGGCMHMVCTRPQCGFDWCWICQTEWTRECMGSHWFS